MTIDHIQPRSQGGTDTLDNLVYCCHACNEFKGDYWQPDSPRRTLHPLRDNVAEHIALSSDDTLRPLTVTGAFHIQRLHLNRSELVAHRREQRLLEEARAVQQATLNRLAQMEQHIQLLQAQIDVGSSDKKSKE